jgi:hypothetical protein
MCVTRMCSCAVCVFLSATWSIFMAYQGFQVGKYTCAQVLVPDPAEL